MVSEEAILLQKILDAYSGAPTPAQVWAYATRTLTDPAADSDLAHMLVGISPTAAGRAALLAERDRRVLQAQGLGEFILYQAESALVAAGRLAEKDRIVSEDRMLKVAEYLRALYRLDDEKEKGTDPDDVVIPVLPRKEAAVEPVKESR